MLKYIKRRHVDEEADSENQSKLSEPNASKAVADKKIRLYNDSYLAMGFTRARDENCPLPSCIVCRKRLSNMAMVPAKLSRHFKTNHSHLPNKKNDYFQ
jgi:hypothetical protein